MAVMPTNTGLAQAQAAVVVQAHVVDARAVAGALQGAGHVQELQRHLRVGRPVPPGKDEQHLVGRLDACTRTLRPQLPLGAAPATSR